MRSAVSFPVALALLVCLAVRCQTAAAPAFEVATVKPAAAGERSSSGISTGHGRLDARNVTVKRCILGAYMVGPHQVIGGPDWMSSDRYDILAKTEQPIEDDATFMVLLEGLLKDRFALALHTETRTLPAYVLEIGKDAPRLGPPEPGEASNSSSTSNTTAELNARHVDMDRLAQVLSRSLDLPVVNATHLAGAYTFRLHWLPQNGSSAAQTGSDELPIATSIREQLGLALRVARVPVQVIVVDHLERPTPN